MIDKVLINESVALMGGFDSDEIKKFSPFISAAASAVSAKLADKAYESDPRVIQLAAAAAYKAICCTAEKSDNITSFTAGDITIKQEADALAGADAYYALATENCMDLFKPEQPEEDNEPEDEIKPEPVKNDGFAFLGV